MADRILVFYGSYRSDRQGIRLADFLVRAFRARGADAELIDAKAIGLPMLDRMYKEYPAGEAPKRWSSSRARSGAPTRSYSSPASTTGGSSLASRI